MDIGTKKVLWGEAKADIFISYVYPEASVKGEPVVLGKKINSLLYRLLETLEQVGFDLKRVSKSGDAASWLLVKGAGHDIENICSALKFEIQDPSGPNYILSKNTFTR
jgi:hypothetical protein